MILEIDANKARLLYKTAAPELKEMLVEKFGENHFKHDPFSIKSVLDAFAFTGDDYKQWIPWPKPINAKQERDNARSEFEQVIKAVTNDWIPDYGNPNQKKWRCWFKWSDSAGAFVFWYSRYAAANTDSASGAPFDMPSEEIADYVGKQFLPLANKFLIKK